MSERNKGIYKNNSGKWEAFSLEELLKDVSVDDLRKKVARKRRKKIRKSQK